MTSTANPFFPTAVEIVKKAIEEDSNANYEKALQQYESALEWFLKGLKHEKNPAAKESIGKRVKGYMERAESLKKVIDDQNRSTNSGKSVGGAASATRGVDDKQKKDEESDRMRGELSSAIISNPNVKWDDVAGLEGAKEALREAVIFPIKFPQFFTGKRKPWAGILLYGPPGTGKSFLAKAVATEADSKFFSISSSDLVSKWIGESEKQVKTLFELARELKPSIIFIDEIDSLVTSRSEGESESSRRIKTEFLVQMNGVGTDQSGVLVLGATNVPWELDPAMRRRFEKRVYIPLPEAQARSVMIKLNLGNTPHELTESDFSALANNSEGLSGSDISVMAREALMEPIRKCQVAKQFILDKSTNLYSPCLEYPNCPHCPMALHDTSSKSGGIGSAVSASTQNFEACSNCGAERKSLYSLPNGGVEVPKVCIQDFEKALARTHSSVGADELSRFVEWTNEFGQEGL